MRSKKEFIQQNGHLSIELKSLFPIIYAEKVQKILPIHDAQLNTNFGITVHNPYIFVLLHLRNRGIRNPTNINIPAICIFHDRIPYDVLYSSKGHIKGIKSAQYPKIRLKDMNRVFKDINTSQGLPKSQQSIAAFLQKQMLNLSDNDIFLVSCKTKIDSFFKKLLYIRNKIPANDNKSIKVSYCSQDTDDGLLKLATQSLLSTKQSQILEKLRIYYPKQQKYSQKYLQYQIQKMVLFVNYQHNIRIKSADFIFTKTVENQYYFIDLHNLIFSNLTNAIYERQNRIKKEEEQNFKILELSPEKYEKYAAMENQNLKVYEGIMNDQFRNIVTKLNLNKISDNKREQVKNQLAFRKLHPKSRYTYSQVINSKRFLKVKDELLQNSNKKSITQPSRYVMRFYNQVRDNRVKTEVIDVMDF